MCEILSFLKSNLDKIWTIIATLIGAFVSYKATTASEKRKEKRTAQKEKLKEILIPLCSSIEVAMAAIDQYKTIQFKDFDVAVNGPSDYLKAEKRVYLSKKERTELEEYDRQVRTFYSTWKKEQEDVLLKYKEWLAKQMCNCPDAPCAMDVSFSLGLKESDLKVPVLEKKSETFIKSVSCITFIINDDPDNFHEYTVSINDEIRTLCGEMDYGIITIEDIDDPQKQLDCKIYDYLMHINDKNAVTEILSATKTNDNLFNVAAKAKKFQELLLKDIDRIAG